MTVRYVYIHVYVYVHVHVCMDNSNIVHFTWCLDNLKAHIQLNVRSLFLTLGPQWSVTSHTVDEMPFIMCVTFICVLHELCHLFSLDQSYVQEKLCSSPKVWVSLKTVLCLCITFCSALPHKLCLKVSGHTSHTSHSPKDLSSQISLPFLLLSFLSFFLILAGRRDMRTNCCPSPTPSIPGCLPSLSTDLPPLDSMMVRACWYTCTCMYIIHNIHVVC